MIDALIAAHHPDLIVIELGDTMASYGLPELPRAWVQQQVRVLTARIAAQRTACAWVGPPWGSEGLSYPKTFVRVKEISEFLSTMVAPCRFIDSTRFARPGEWPTIDGQHLTGDGYRAWGADIAASVAVLLRDRLPRTP